MTRKVSCIVFDSLSIPTTMYRRGAAEGFPTRSFPKRRKPGRISCAVSFSFNCSLSGILFFHQRKNQSNVQAVDERQELETLHREEKTSSRTLASQKDKLNQWETKKAKLLEDATSSGERKEQVDIPLYLGILLPLETDVIPSVRRESERTSSKSSSG